MKDSESLFQEPIENIQLSTNDFKGNALLNFCSLLSTITRYNGLLYSILNVYIVLFLDNNAFESESLIARLAIPISHTYLVLFGVAIFFSEKESSYFFKQFVSYKD